MRRKNFEVPLIQKLRLSAENCQDSALACSLPHSRMPSFIMPIALITCELRAGASAWASARGGGGPARAGRAGGGRGGGAAGPGGAGPGGRGGGPGGAGGR